MSQPQQKPDFTAPHLIAVSGGNGSMDHAGFFGRVLAFFIDWLILAAMACVLLVMSTVFFPIAFVAILAVCFYGPAMESSSLEGTLGHHLMGIRICDENGDRISFGRAVARNVLKFLLNELTLGISWLFPLWTEQKQALHDMACKTYSVKKSPY